MDTTYIYVGTVGTVGSECTVILTKLILPTVSTEPQYLRIVPTVPTILTVPTIPIVPTVPMVAITANVFRLQC